MVLKMALIELSLLVHDSYSLTSLRKRYSDMVLYFPSSQNAMWNCFATKTSVNPFSFITKCHVKLPCYKNFCKSVFLHHKMPCETALLQKLLWIRVQLSWQSGSWGLVSALFTLELHRLLINRTCGSDALNYTVCSHSQGFGVFLVE